MSAAPPLSQLRLASPPPRPTPTGGLLTAPAATRAHPMLDALAVSLDKVTQQGRSRTTRGASSHSARASVPTQLPLPTSPAAAAASHTTRRQTSATMRRKLVSLDAPHAIGLAPLHDPHAHTARGVDSLPSPSSRSHPTDVPPSLLPPSAHSYTRVPLTNFVAALSQQPSSGHSWETRTFPSSEPTSLLSEGEVRRLAGWFEATWIQLEQEAQRQAVWEQRKHMKEMQQSAASSAAHSDEKSVGVASTAAGSLPALSAALLHSLGVSREKLCFLVFHELIRHVSVWSPPRGSLLDRVWSSLHRLTEQRLAHRVDEVIAISESQAKRAVDQLTADFSAQLRVEQASQIKSGVDLTYLAAELDAKERIIANLQEENDKDLLYSNQIVCHKEMAFLKLDRDSQQVRDQNAKLTEEVEYLSSEKIGLEDAVTKLEEEKEELQMQCNAIQQLVDARAPHTSSVATQYEATDAPPEPSVADVHVSHAAADIQKLFRGFRARRQLKSQGLLSRKAILKKMEAARAHTRRPSIGVADSNSTAGGVIHASSMPSVPRGFSHLLSPIDMSVARDHFIRLFARKKLLKWIMHLYTEKMSQDGVYRADQSRKDLADFIYDHALRRHGSRDAAEMDLLDLFASVEKHMSSARVRLFLLFLQNGFRHRRVVASAAAGRDGRAHDESDSDQPADGAAASAASSASPYHHMDKHERHAHELKLRMSLALHGGRHLSSRVLDFSLRFLSVVLAVGRGPFDVASDDTDGVMWVDLTSIVDLASKAMRRLPKYLVQAMIAKLHAQTTVTREQIIEMATAARTHKEVTHTNESRSSSHPLVDLSHRFIEFDVALEVLVETFLDEDARMHHDLHDRFMQPNPLARADESRDMHAVAAAAATARVDPNTPLEPEMFSFLHFCDVLRTLPMAATWDDDRMMSAYHQAVQRAIHRPVSIDDFVLTVRCYGVMPVDIDWSLLSPSSGASRRPAAAAGTLLSDEDLLPPIDDDLGGRTDEAAARQKQSLKEKLREAEATLAQRMDFAHRRHEKEITQVKQVHEREIALRQQAHQEQMNAIKRELDLSRSQSAVEYNSLVDSTTAELTHLKRALEQREQRDSESAANAHNTFQARSETQLKRAQGTRLAECARTIELLQSKLSSKNEKYVKKKSSASALQARVVELESQLARATATIASSVAAAESQASKQTAAGRQMSTEAQNIIEEYKKSDEENRKINASLQSELSSLKSKYKSLVKHAKDLMRQAQLSAASSPHAQNDAQTDAKQAHSTTTSTPSSRSPVLASAPSVSESTRLAASSSMHTSLPTSSRATPEIESESETE